MPRDTFIEVIGADRVNSSLDPAHWRDAMKLSLHRAGLAVEAEMKHAAKPHHDTGNLERTITTTPPVDHGSDIEVRVGIGRAATPEGRPLAFGWRSSHGLQPPVAPIAAWMTRHGVGAGLSPSQFRSRAFLIARAIGRRGYRFGADDWFHKGIEAGRPKVREIIQAAIRERRR